jgi:hypothetical protein
LRNIGAGAKSGALGGAVLDVDFRSAPISHNHTPISEQMEGLGLVSCKMSLEQMWSLVEASGEGPWK